MNSAELESKLTSEELLFLEGKKNNAFLYLIIFSVGLIFGILLYAVVLKDAIAIIILSLVSSAVMMIPIWKNLNLLLRINKDIEGGAKKVLTTEIQDFKEAVQNNRQGEKVSADYFLFLDGEKYQVKEEHYYPFGKGDLVKAYVSPNSKFAFHVEKIT